MLIYIFRNIFACGLIWKYTILLKYLDKQMLVLNAKVCSIRAEILIVTKLQCIHQIHVPCIVYTSHFADLFEDNKTTYFQDRIASM